MSQTKRNLILQAGIGSRLAQLVELHLGRSWSEMAVMLGYANSSTLLAAKEGACALSVEKLALLAEQVFEGHRVNVDWLITGKGFPMVSAMKAPAIGERELLLQRVSAAPRTTQKQIEAFLIVSETTKRSKESSPSPSGESKQRT